MSHARRFLDGLSCGGELAGVTAADVIGAVLRESAAVSVSATQFFVAGLRSFLRFCFLVGLMGPTCPRRRCRRPDDGGPCYIGGSARPTPGAAC